MRYLVTGGAGFIGGAIAKELIGIGQHVVVLDNLSTGDRIPQGAEFVELDISDPTAFDRMPQGSFDAVLHLAGQSSGEISHDRPAYDLQTNALGTLLLLRWCQQNGIQRFLYASSMSIYGNVADEPVREDKCCTPLSFYGITKQTAEQYIRYFSSRGLATTVFRMFNVYGPGQNLTNMKQGMVSIYLAFMLRQEAILVKGARDRFRDFVYIDDVRRAWIDAIDATNTFGKTYNLGSGTRTQVDELIAELIGAWGCPDGDYPVTYAGSTPGDQHGIYADISRLRSDLPWSPEVPLGTGLTRMVTWARSRQ